MGGSVDDAVARAAQGKLEYGSTTSYGLASDGIALTYENNGNLVPKDVIAKVDALKRQVSDGKIEVPTALGNQ